MAALIKMCFIAMSFNLFEVLVKDMDEQDFFLFFKQNL